MTNLKFSIITPSFNQGEYIEDTIKSVLEQNYPNLEYIIIDGGSNDNSVEIIKKYEKHLTYWVSEKDKGQSEAINKGFKRATGDIITWINSDDIVQPNTFHLIAEYFSKNQSIDLIHGQSVLFGENFNEKIVGYDDIDLAHKYLAYIPFPQPSSYFRKSLLNKIGLLNDSLHYGMDYDFFVRAYLANLNFMKVDEFLSRYRMHPLSKSNHELKFALEWAKIFSNVLLSYKGTDQLINTLKKAGLFNPTNEGYLCERDLKIEDLKQGLLYHLKIQANYHYSELELKKSEQISKIIKEIDEEFYYNNSINKIFWRSSLLPKVVISFIRKFSRA